jgi:hypothetical protein
MMGFRKKVCDHGTAAKVTTGLAVRDADPWQLFVSTLRTRATDQTTRNRAAITIRTIPRDNTRNANGPETGYEYGAVAYKCRMGATEARQIIT